VCHSDLHQARNDWNNSIFPMVPGHEIIGRVTAVGSAVTKFKVGDRVGVGCMVDSCRNCSACAKGLEQYCAQFPIVTYTDPHGTPTYGGYSESIAMATSSGLGARRSIVHGASGVVASCAA
jgi:uncharacterized zinc-type alcohol dehydrogenase-like protein